MLIAVIVGPLAAFACDRDQRRLARSGCAMCGLLGYVVGRGVVREAQDHHRLGECGRCPRGERCNVLYDPPRCAPHPGGEGDRCGLDGRLAYVCRDGLRCAARGGQQACVSLPREGEPCDYVGSYRGECARGLTCASDDRCRRLCPDCPGTMTCNPLDAPPRCVAQPFPAGARCGLYARGDAGAHGTWYACSGVCVARGDDPPRCEPSDPSWRGPSCGSHRCPDGARCRVTVCELR
jgi:hypothetical protein